MSINLYAGAILNYVFNNLVTHLPSHFIRKSFLRIINKKIHRHSVILMHVRLLNFWNLEIGERVVINQYCLLDCRRHKIVINNDTDIGPYTKIWTSGHNPNSDVHALYGGNVIIGHHVWIAAGVTILPDVSIADGTVIGAESIVHKSTGTLDIVAGNPARFIKKRVNSLSYTLHYKPILE